MMQILVHMAKNTPPMIVFVSTFSENNSVGLKFL